MLCTLADRYIGEKNGNKYSIFASTDKNKEVLEKYTTLWDEIKYHIKTKDGSESSEYGKDYMKIQFNSGDNLPLKKILTLPNLAIIVRSAFQEDNKYFPQAFLDECLYEL